ncbi:MAG: aldose 1-epimerase family protein [Spirochaetaceae bacterium]|nr:aldose 1-epimerase family protein [Spirochaetaceae bacterium]
MGDTGLSRREILRRCGDATQLLGVKEYRLEGGRAAGVRAIDARNGSGLEFTALPDRGMDIAWLSLGGRNLSYIGSPGIAGPQYFDDRDLGWLRSFAAGFLTTCGLRNVGSPCEEGGESFGLHGRAANAPAEAVSADVDWEGVAPALRLSGRMREARVFGENLMLTRMIEAACGRNVLVIEDRVDNLGFREEPLELLYHFNLGYPLLDAGAEFLAPSRDVRPRDETARRGLPEWARAEAPTPSYSEQVFYHDLRSDGRGMTCVALVNRAARLGVALRFDLKELPRLTQWKMMGEGEYVMGVEPCNCPVEGRARAREAGALEILDPGAHRCFRIEAEFLGDEAGIDRIVAEISRL